MRETQAARRDGAGHRRCRRPTVWASPALPGSVHDLTAAGTHNIFEPLTSTDVMIFDEGDYQSWMKTGEVDTFYGNYPGEDHGDNFHGFFTAPEDGEYLVIVCNRSGREVEMRLDISYAD